MYNIVPTATAGEKYRYVFFGFLFLIILSSWSIKTMESVRAPHRGARYSKYLFFLFTDHEIITFLFLFFYVGICCVVCAADAVAAPAGISDRFHQYSLPATQADCPLRNSSGTALVERFT